MHELHNEFPDDLAVIAWHVDDDFEIPSGSARANWYQIAGCPTAWFDGAIDVIGASSPSNYSNYLPVFEERMSTPTNFRLEMEISNTDATNYNVWASFEILEGINTENLAAFVALTETGLPYTGLADQVFVARSVWPNATLGHAMDFSTQSVVEIETTVSLEDDYVFENCEVVVWLQNMDTKEIYQGTSLMMTDIVGLNDEEKFVEMEVYPNPANDRLSIKSSLAIEQIEIYNQLGQLAKQYIANSNLVNLNVSGLESGMYFIKVYSANKVSSQKLVIE